MATVLYVLAETIRRLALLTQAFLPDASARILDQLAVRRGRAHARALPGRLGDAAAGHAAAGTDRRVPALREASGAMLVDSHCHLDFPALAEEERCGHRARPMRPGSR